MWYAASCDSSRKGAPGSHNMRTRSRGSSLPRATCFLRAASPPPIAIWSIFARRSSTSDSISRAFAWNDSSRGLSFDWICVMTRLLPAARLEPLFEHRHPVATPERLAIDDEERRAEHAARDRLLDLGLERRLELRIVDRGLCGGAVVAESGSQ